MRYPLVTHPGIFYSRWMATATAQRSGPKGGDTIPDYGGHTRLLETPPSQSEMDLLQSEQSFVLCSAEMHVTTTVFLHLRQAVDFLQMRKESTTTSGQVSRH